MIKFCSPPRLAELAHNTRRIKPLKAVTFALGRPTTPSPRSSPARGRGRAGVKQDVTEGLGDPTLLNSKATACAVGVRGSRPSELKGKMGRCDGSVTDGVTLGGHRKALWLQRL
jgi:hypothetical protein